MEDAPPPIARPLRWLWMTAGLICVGLGGLGVIVPGLPTTIFFIGAAACFTRSSSRLERWVLGLPGVGPMVRDYRAGLGMPRRAKVAAVASIVGFSALAVVLLDKIAVRATIGAAALVGVVVVVAVVPLRERVLAERAAAANPGDRRPNLTP